jgi:hypothetical protein
VKDAWLLPPTILGKPSYKAPQIDNGVGKQMMKWMKADIRASIGSTYVRLLSVSFN